MKLAVLSESPADEAALRILAEALLGATSEVVGLDVFQYRSGWQAVLKIMPLVMRHLHYQTDADGLLVSLDSDKSPIHEAAHEAAGQAVKHCRICSLRDILRTTQAQLKTRGDGSRLKVAIGLAVPQIEAWYRCGWDSTVTEAAWRVGLRSGKFPFTSDSLKRDVYGSLLSGLELETLRAIEEARRLATCIEELETWFPAGFGYLSREVRTWRTTA
ncbi:MAG: hypothetical protein JNM56_35330 [Planctomycetia bacterium]|nr:hypothetical protein [Planctomycetia bacterium]